MFNNISGYLILQMTILLLVGVAMYLVHNSQKDNPIRTLSQFAHIYYFAQWLVAGLLFGMILSFPADNSFLRKFENCFDCR